MPPHLDGVSSAAAGPLRGSGESHSDRATLGLCVLGSGSGGNCSVVRLGNRVLMIDAGLGPRRTFSRLSEIGSDIEAVAGLCVTHLDQDHFRPLWTGVLRQFRIPLHVHRWHLPDLVRFDGVKELEVAGLVRVFDGQPFAPLPGVTVRSIPLPHDDQGTVGFRLDTPAGSIGYATDLGHVPPELIDVFSAGGGVGVLAIECNYDPAMQARSSRPWFLKNRIMGGHGHLSNEESFDAVRRIAHRSAPGLPAHVVLLHRSAQCNHPAIVRRVFGRDERIGPRIILTEQRRRSRWVYARPVAPLVRDQMRLGLAGE